MGLAVQVWHQSLGPQSQPSGLLAHMAIPEATSMQMVPGLRGKTVRVTMTLTPWTTHQHSTLSKNAANSGSNPVIRHQRWGRSGMTLRRTLVHFGLEQDSTFGGI